MPPVSESKRVTETSSCLPILTLLKLSFKTLINHFKRGKEEVKKEGHEGKINMWKGCDISRNGMRIFWN